MIPFNVAINILKFKFIHFYNRDSFYSVISENTFWNELKSNREESNCNSNFVEMPATDESKNNSIKQVDLLKPNLTVKINGKFRLIYCEILFIQIKFILAKLEDLDTDENKQLLTEKPKEKVIKNVITKNISKNLKNHSISLIMYK